MKLNVALVAHPSSVQSYYLEIYYLVACKLDASVSLLRFPQYTEGLSVDLCIAFWNAH